MMVFIWPKVPNFDIYAYFWFWKLQKIPFSKGGPLPSKKSWKFWDFHFNFFFCISLFWTNISYFSINQPKKWIYWGENEKNYSIFSPLFSLIQMTSIWKFLIKIRIDIKIGNLWPYKNHHSRSKYPIVLLQECCEKIQFKSGHPVYILICLILETPIF